MGTVNCGGNETPFDNGWHTQTAERTGRSPGRVASMQDVDGELIPIIKLGPDSRARRTESRESRESSWMMGGSGRNQTSRTPTGLYTECRGLESSSLSRLRVHTNKQNNKLLLREPVHPKRRACTVRLRLWGEASLLVCRRHSRYASLAVHSKKSRIRCLPS